MCNGNEDLQLDEDPSRRQRRQFVPHALDRVEVVDVREHVGDPLGAGELLYQLARVEHVRRHELRVLHAGLHWQQPGDVEVVDPEEGDVVGGAVQPDHDVRRHHVRAAGAVGRVGVVLELLLRHLPLALPHHLHAGPRAAHEEARRVLRLQVAQQREHVDENVVVGLEDEARVRAVLGDPLERRDALVAQVVVGVEEVLLHDVAVRVALVGERVLPARPVVADAEHEDDADGVGVLPVVAPRLPDHRPPLVVARRRVHVDEEEDGGVAARVTRVQHVLERVRVRLSQRPARLRRVRPADRRLQVAHVHLQQGHVGVQLVLEGGRVQRLRVCERHRPRRTDRQRPGEAGRSPAPHAGSRHHHQIVDAPQVGEAREEDHERDDEAVHELHRQSSAAARESLRSES